MDLLCLKQKTCLVYLSQLAITHHNFSVDDGIPHMWVKKMKEAIRTTAHQFSARRMLKDYVRMGYDPALKNAVQYRK